jgi:hypothetical protein
MFVIYLHQIIELCAQQAGDGLCVASVYKRVQWWGSCFEPLFLWYVAPLAPLRGTRPWRTASTIAWPVCMGMAALQRQQAGGVVSVMSASGTPAVCNVAYTSAFTAATAAARLLW